MDIVEAFSTKNKCYQVGALLRPPSFVTVAMPDNRHAAAERRRAGAVL